MWRRRVGPAGCAYDHRDDACAYIGPAVPGVTNSCGASQGELTTWADARNEDAKDLGDPVCGPGWDAQGCAIAYRGLACEEVGGRVIGVDGPDVYELLCEDISVRECVWDAPTLARIHMWSVRATDDSGAWVASDWSFKTEASSIKDTDLDGISDAKESDWWSPRNSVFCASPPPTGPCEFPNPLEQDIYVEIDAMYKPACGVGCAGDYSMMPTTAQLEPIKFAFDSQGIRIHFDTGNLGGGEVLPQSEYRQLIWFDPTSGPSGAVSFEDYKTGGNGISAAHFDATNRKGIYRYALMGHQYLDTPTSSGAAWIWDDDIFVSYGHIKENQSAFRYANFDHALAGTIMHELGHSLCLRNITEGPSPGTCAYSEIDEPGPAGQGGLATYESVMNYAYQMKMPIPGYSDGSRDASGTTGADFDDWGAIVLTDDWLTKPNNDEGAGQSAPWNPVGPGARQPAYNMLHEMLARQRESHATELPTEGLVGGGGGRVEIPG